jgi:hypothetical protein
MSYSQYLKNKMAAAPKILNTRKPLEASEITTKRRLGASSFFNVDGADKGTMREASDMETSRGKAPISYQKQTGIPKDSSDFTAYRGSQGLGNDAAHARGRLLAHSNDLTSISTCVDLPAINRPVFHTTGRRTANTVPTSGSDFIRQKIACAQRRTPHTSGQVGPPLFVDDTIRIPQVDPTVCCPTVANHSIKANVPFERTISGPTKFTTLGYQEGNDPPYKAGALIASAKYIEKHHGNDLHVNPKRPFVKFQGSHLATRRINEPRFGVVKP